MVVHWLRERSEGWRWRSRINGSGAVLTGIVAAVVIVAKAPSSLLVAILIPILVAIMQFIQRQYRASNAQLSSPPDIVLPPPQRQKRRIVPGPRIDRAAIQAINVARSNSQDIQAA